MRGFAAALRRQHSRRWYQHCRGLCGSPYGQLAPSGQFGPRGRVPRCLRWGGPPPVPTKLTAKIKRGEFIEMAELLPEFWSSIREDDHSKQEAKSWRARSVQDMLTWLQCYSLYVRVIGPQHPSRIPELMAYQANIVRASQDYTGLAWVRYDSAFRRQAALTGLTWWSAINPTLYTLYFVRSARTATRCELCFATTHHTKECAQQGDPDPGVRDRLRAIEKAVLSLTPGAGPLAAVLPRGGGSGESTFRSGLPLVER